jgi:undecaprenyl-diphosphatase
MAGVTQAFNWKLLLPIRRPGDHTPLGPPAIQEMAHDITALGGATVLGLLTASIADFLALDDKKANGFLDVGCVISGLITSTLLKALFNRPRPTLLPIPVCCRF